MSHLMEPGPDPFAHDVDRLMAISSEPIVRRGVAYFKDNRVMEIDWDAEHVWALVEGSVPDQPYSVELGRDADGELLVECDRPFDWEPVCKHAVAAGLADVRGRHGGCARRCAA